MICDTYEPFLKRSESVAPRAASVTDYRGLLDSAAVDRARLSGRGQNTCTAKRRSPARSKMRVRSLAGNAVTEAGLPGRPAGPRQLTVPHVSQFVKSGVLGNVALVPVPARFSRRRGNLRNVG
jgi:hypothetical protein